MDDTYDQIILGTGLKECILSGLLSVAKNKVLHMDRNDFYGAESASLNLKKVFEKFGGTDEKLDEDAIGRSKDFNIDLCPKFIMACGNLVKLLLHTKVTRYLEFKCVDGSYVYKAGKLHIVPVTPTAAMNTEMLGMMAIRRYKNFLVWVLDFNPDDKKTWATGWGGGWGGAADRLELDKITPKQVFDYWKLDNDTVEFTGHAIALYPNESYMNDKTKTIEYLVKCKLYAYSLSRYKTSPYIYPVYGLGGLPESFSRLAAVHGGTYMLRHDIKNILYNEDKTVKGVKVKPCGMKGCECEKNDEAYCKKLVGDPSYFIGTNMVKKTGQIARWICILNKRVPNTVGDSAQIIIPGKQAKRKTDIYISVMSNALQCCPKGRFVAMLSCKVEKKYNSVEATKKELVNATKLLGTIVKDFFYVCDSYEPTDKKGQMAANIHITSSMDETTHFQSCSQEVMRMFQEITGNTVSLEADPTDVGTDKQYE